MSIGIIREEKLRTRRAILTDALIQGVGFVRVRFSVLDRRRELAGGVPGEGGGAVVQRIPGGIVAVDLGDRACHILQAITIRCHGIRVIRATRLGIGAVAVGVIAPEFEAGVV